VRRIEITDAELGCIRYRHAMRPTGEIRRRKRERDAPFGNEVTLRCGECGSYRFDTYDRLGQVTVRSYELTPSYQAALDLIAARGLDRNTDVTLEVLRRLRKPTPQPTRLRRVS
jgi:hypothetical protein